MKKKVFSKLLMVALVATVGIFSSCKDYDDDISDVRNSIQTNVTELQKDYNAKIEAANTSITKLQTLYNSLDAAYKSADDALKTLIEKQTSIALNEAKAYSDANLVVAKDAAKAAEDAAKVAAKEYAVAEAAAAQTAAINAAKDQVKAAKDSLQAALNTATQTIALQGVSIGNLITATETLDVAVKAAQARADQAYALADKANTLAEQNKANLEAASADIAKLKTDLANLQGTAAAKADVAKLQSDLAALQSKVNENVVDLASYKESITSINSELAKLTSDLAKQNTNLTESIAAVKATADANVASIDAIKSQLATIDAAWQLADENINKTILALAATVDANQTEAANNLKAAVDAITAELAAKQTLIENNDAAIRTLIDTKVSELSKLINDNAETIKANAKAIADNKTAQDAANVLMNNAIAQNAKDIAEKSAAQSEKNSSFEKAIEAIKKALGDDTAETLKAYAKSIAESNALQAKLDAQGYADAQDAAQSLTLLAAIADQAEQDQKAWTAAINTAVDNLVKTYQLNALAELIAAAQENAEKNAAVKAQEIANKALADAQSYADGLNDLLKKDLEAAAKNLKDNYTTTVDMTAAIETARAAAVNQAYLKVLNALLRDYPEWYDLTEEKKLSEDVLPVTILQLAQKAAAEYIEKYGLTKDNAQALIDATIEAGLQPTKYLGTDAEGNELYSTPGVIMKEIELAAAACDKNMMDKFGELDVRLQPIEEFLGETLGEGDAFIASVNAIIAASTTAADVETLKKQIAGTEESGLLTLINGLDAQAKQTAADVQAISNAIKNINDKFSADPKLDPKAADSSVDASALTAFAQNIEDLINRVNKNSKLVDNLENEVMKAFNKNLGPQIQSMITSINLFANQHMADLDEQYKLAYWNGDEYEYPAGYEGFDHELTFVYTIEQGIYSDLKGKVKIAEWNYPEGLFTQLMALPNTRPVHFAEDYHYDYTNVSFGAMEKNDGKDFVDGRYRSYEDSILVRVQPTNADLSKAEIALINTKGEDIIAAGLIEILKDKDGNPEIKKYTREAPLTRFKANTRADEEEAAPANKETGLWVIKFKLNDGVVGEKWAQYAQYNGNQIVYAVAVKNTDFSTDETEDVDRYITSEFDLSLATEAAKHNNDFTVESSLKKESIAKIHNRYIQAEQSENGTTSWTDDPFFTQNKFRYELTWKDLCDEDLTKPAEGGDDDENLKNTWYEYCWDCCYLDNGEPNPDCVDENGKFVGRNEIGYTTIFFDGETDGYEENPYACGINTVDRFGHTFDKVTGVRNMDNGVDNRHKYEPLPIEFSKDQAPAGEDGEWAKIEIEFPSINQCGERTPIRGFFVTMDQHFAIESDNSEMNAWPTYITKNVAKYPYETINGVTKIKSKEEAMLKMFEQSVTLQKGNKGTIWLKDARNLADGDVVGFRVHAVNLDGTFTDPDGRAFYVKVGNKSNKHELSFHITATDYETGDSAVQDLVDGKNPIAQYNADMAKAKSDLRFFQRPAYGPSYENQDDFRVILTWREGNPAIRGWLTNGKNAWVPVAGTGKGVENDYVGDYGIYSNYAVVKNADDGRIPDVINRDFSVEKFFSFKFSKTNVLNNDGIADAYWYEYGNNDDADATLATVGANVKTSSVLAFINPGVEDRLIDGATYKVTMTIQQLDQKTTWITKNVIDIDITKVMPTESGLSVKTGQTDDLADGIWKFYVRPLVAEDLNTIAINDLDPAQGNGRIDDGAAAADPWKITWNAFKPEFETDFDADGNAIDANQHLYRWAADTRPWTMDEMFNGLMYKEYTYKTVDGEDVLDKVETKLSKDFYFVFKGAGNFVAAHKQIGTVEAKEKWSTEALYDDFYKDADGTVVYNPNPTVSVAGDATHQEIGYRMPFAHYSHVGNGTYNVLGGKIFRRVSANLDETGVKFLEPKGEAAGSEGFVTPILNRDFKLEAKQIKTTDNKDLKAQYICALSAELNVPTTVGPAANATPTMKYNEQKAIDIFGTDGATTAGTKYSKMAPKGKSYVDTKFPAAWTTLPKLSELIAGKYAWVDYSSIKVVLPGNAPYILSEWYDYYFAENKTDGLEKAIDPSDAKNNSKIKYLIVKPNRTGLLSALTKDYDAVKVSYEVYDVWYHGPKTVTVNGLKILKPENPSSRQAR